MIPCGKRSYGSERAAKMACRTMGNRIRVYWCEDCGGVYHVANQDAHRGDTDQPEYETADHRRRRERAHR